MRAELRGIQPNDFLDWDAFVDSKVGDPLCDHGSFTLDIGGEGLLGADMFQAVVSTPAAASRGRGKGQRQFRGFLVDAFEPERIASVIRTYVLSVEGKDWAEIVAQLRLRLHWEYEGMEPI